MRMYLVGVLLVAVMIVLFWPMLYAAFWFMVGLIKGITDTIRAMQWAKKNRQDLWRLCFNSGTWKEMCDNFVPIRDEYEAYMKERRQGS